MKKQFFKNTFIFIFNKVIRVIASITFYFYKYKIVILREDRIGHQVGNFDKELFKAEKRRLKKKIQTIFLFVCPPKDVANYYVRDQFRKLLSEFDYNYKVFRDDNLLEKLFIKIFENKKLIQNNRHFFISGEDYQPEGFISKPIIYTSDNYINLCNKLEIEPNKYICIYARDSQYLNEKFSSRDWDYHNYRNSDIDSLRLLSDYVIKELGLSVIRVGSIIQKKINWTRNIHPKIIDYSASEFVSNKNDVDLIAGCNLYIHNGGGLHTIVKAARKKMIRINSIPIFQNYGYYYGFKITKLLKKNNGRYLGFREIASMNLGAAAFSNCFLESNVIVEDNSPEDILDVLKDHFKWRNGLLNEEDKKLIEEYKKVMDELSREYGFSNTQINIISPSFLKRHKFLLS